MCVCVCVCVCVCACVCVCVLLSHNLSLITHCQISIIKVANFEEIN